MPINREAALKRAEKLLRQGKLDRAIEEYVWLIQDQPGDWNSINVLGDLYLRAGDLDRAVEQFIRVADHLFTEGFLSKAAALYKKALKVQGQHEQTLSQLAEIAVRQKLLADAKTYLRQLEQVRRLRGDEPGVSDCLDRLRSLEEADLPASSPSEPLSEDPAVLFGIAVHELAVGNDLKARATLTRALTLDPGRHADAMRVALDLTREGRIESAFGCIDVVTDAALLGGQLNHAVEALQAFVREVPHIPALIKLVEVSVDAGLDKPLRAAQSQLADAYLDAGKGAEARVISEDLLENNPDAEPHAERVRRAFGLLGISGADKVIADLRASRREPESDVPPEPEAPPPAKRQAAPETIEVDLSDILTTIGIPQSEAELSGWDPYRRAMKHLQAGRIADAIADFEAAALSPHMRGIASAELGRLHIQRGELQAGVEWLERAADGPAATPEEASAVLYDLADVLEKLGEPARALAILVDLDADSSGYRDVRTRIEHLSRVQAGSHGG